MGTTSFALNTILSERAMTKEDIIDYLEDSDHANFKALSSILKNAMNISTVCPDNQSVTSYSKTLYNLLQKQDEECNIPQKERKSERTIERWLANETDHLRYRDDVIKICFALKLGLDDSTEMLYKCGFNGFNVRNVYDAVYLYCLENQKPYSVALKLIDDFFDNTIAPSDTDSNNRIHSGNTTQQMNREIIEAFHSQSEDSFFKNYLIKRRDSFIGYSTSAEKEYYILKNNLFVIVLLEALINERDSGKVNERIKYEAKPVRSRSPEDLVPENEICYTLAFRSAIEKHNSSDSLLYPAYTVFNDNLLNIIDAMMTIRDIVIKKTDIESQKILSGFFNDIMKIEGFLKYTIDSLRGDNSRIRKYTGSVLSNNVMYCFPKPCTFSDYEKKPKEFGHTLSIRKAIILMYYIRYVYYYSIEISDPRFQPDYGQMDLYDFMDKLNDVLAKSMLAPLYPANQYDWLILKSIQVFESCDDPENMGIPTEFFNKIIALSFGDSYDEE